VSKIEGKEDVHLSTLRGYVEALGGHLEVNAFSRIRLSVLPCRTSRSRGVGLVAARRSRLLPGGRGRARIVLFRSTEPPHGFRRVPGCGVTQSLVAAGSR
jgi:hypothetical protein